ncbi:MAG TPA: glutamyl-tRNA reductase, partial [Chitinophagaceae bacterium]|nr:glutamyl-tRNA reductase [Chitinophagaceae bacterium]
MESYKLITVTHKTTHISRLKDYLLTEEDSDFPARRLTELKESMQLSELFYLNTCNRVTFFFVNEGKADKKFMSNLFSFINPRFDKALLDVHMRSAQVFEGDAAVRHLFDVSASLDSLVVGEREILRQLKDAYAKCRKYGLCGDSIRLVMEQAIVLSKKVCNETRLAEKPVSVVSLAFREMMQVGLDKYVAIAMIGAGQTNSMLANLLEKYGFQNVAVFNRTIEKAEELAQKVGGKAYHLSQIYEVKLQPRLIISCTGAAEPVVDTKLMKHWQIDPELPVTIMDLGVPANVDGKVLKKYKANYIHVAGLEKIAEENKAFRQKEMQKAEALIEDFMETFHKIHRERLVERAMGEIPGKVKALRSRAYSVFKKDIEHMDAESREVLEK